MPPWVAFAPRLTSLTKGRAIERFPAVLRCSHATPRSLYLRCFASTHVSPTAINLRPHIPPRNKELYDALSALSGAAETYVNISRLQLALSGLAAQDAVTRVASMFSYQSRRSLADRECSAWPEQSVQRSATCALAPRRSIGRRRGMGARARESWRRQREGGASEVSMPQRQHGTQEC